MGLVLLCILGFRYLLSRDQKGHGFRVLLPAATVIGVLYALLVVLVDKEEWLRFYPVLTNMFFLSVFATSLFHPPPIIERLARLRHPELSPRGVHHTRQVTVVWCGFFVLNGAVALLTALYASMKFWTLYNGLLSYLGMALLFVLEYPIRRARMAADEREAQESC